MNWLKENWFKIGLLIILLILLGVFYSSLTIWQARTNEANSLKLSQQCSKDGDKLLKLDQQIATDLQYKNGATKCYYMESLYIYNQKLNTCLYSGGYTCDLIAVITDGIFKGEHARQWTRHIIDVYSNKDLVSVSVNDSSSVSDWEREMIDDFWAKSRNFGFSD